jgi:hypothetical protein
MEDGGGRRMEDGERRRIGERTPNAFGDDTDVFFCRAAVPAAEPKIWQAPAFARGYGEPGMRLPYNLRV